MSLAQAMPQYTFPKYFQCATLIWLLLVFNAPTLMCFSQPNPDKTKTACNQALFGLVLLNTVCAAVTAHHAAAQRILVWFCAQSTPCSTATTSKKNTLQSKLPLSSNL